MYSICFDGEVIDGADTREEADRLVRELWATVKDGRSSWWTVEDFDGFASNPDCTGFLDSVLVRKEGA
jgi:hypothetical protein